MTFAGLGTVPRPSYQSTISYNYDAGDRLTSIVDSNSGTITPGFDALDRLLSESTPQGNVTYTYDAASREISMTVAGQPTVMYSYDNAGRVTQIGQGNSNALFSYDANRRRSSLTLPNGVSTAYAYDDASQLLSLSYQGTNPLGNLTYTYDPAGRLTQLSGSFARTGLPAPLSSATYDAANRLTNWAGTTFVYDSNGNLTSDGRNIYTWDARNQLVSISGGVLASFQYDALGRRIGKTASGVTTGFLYDGSNVVQELSGSTPSANLLTGGIDGLLIRSGASIENFLSDGLGSSIATTDATELSRHDTPTTPTATHRLLARRAPMLFNTPDGRTTEPDFIIIAPAITTLPLHALSARIRSDLQGAVRTCTAMASIVR